MSTEPLRHSLRKALLDYRKERPNLSLRAIAKNSGVNRYFLSKVMDDSEIVTALDMNQVLLLAKFITGRESVREVINTSSKEVRDVLEKTIRINYDAKISEDYSDLDLYQSNIYFILVLASYQKGTKVDYIARILGEKGEKTLCELLEDGVVVKREDGRIFLKSGNEFTLSSDLLMHHIPNYLRFYSFAKRGKGRNYFHVFSEGLNKEGYRKLVKLHHDFAGSINVLVSNKEYMGDIPVFTVGCMDSFLEEEQSQEDSSKQS